MKPPSRRLEKTESDEPGKVFKEINGFEILAKVGQGGMGAVYKARQKSLDRVVALKILPPRIAKNATFIERFQREARASAKLYHPNVVHGIDVGQDPKSKLWYFAMEFVDGPTLRKLLKEQKRIPERRALELMSEVARALDAINSVGMVHRDIKPDNILISTRGEVKVADLGLTREVDDDAEMTQSGHAVGTPHYMPPEQVRGEKDLDIRGDLYALGATLFHIVTGETPFKGNSSAEILSKHLTEAPPKASKINEDVTEATSKLILKLMEKKRESRVQTPQELIERIQAILDPGNATTGKRASVPGASGLRPASKGASGLRSAVGKAGTSGPRGAVGKTTGQRTAVGTGSLRPIDGIESTGPLQRVSTGQRASIPPWATTGSADPVSSEGRADAATSANRRAIQTRSPKVAWSIIAVAAVIIAGVCAILLSSGPAKETAKAKVESSPAPTAQVPAAPNQIPSSRHAEPAAKVVSREEKARAEFELAQTIEKEHADDFPAILGALNKAAELAKGTALAAQVSDAQQGVENRWNDNFATALKPMVAAAETASAKGDFAGALAALKDELAPANLRVLGWQQQLEAARKAVRDAAETAAAKILDEARTLAQGGDPAGLQNAIEKSKAADAIGVALAPSAGKAAEERAKWSAAIAELRKKEETAKLERLEKSREVLAAVRKELAPALQQGRFSAAQELLEKKLQDPTLADAKESLQMEKTDLAAIVALRQRAFDALRAMNGKTVTIRCGKSSLSGKVQNDSSVKGIALKLADGPEMTVGPDQLEPADIHAFAPVSEGAEKAEDLRRRGLLFLAVNDLAKSKEFFKAAREAGLGDAANAYLERIEALELGELEIAARKCWAAAEVLFNAKQWKEAQVAYAGFQAEFGKTRTFAQNGAQFQAHTKVVADILAPPIAGLKLWLKLDEKEGTKAANAAENGAPAELTGCKWTSDCKIGSGAIQLNGVSDYVLSPNIGPSLTEGNVTIALWFKAGSGGVIVDELGQAQLDTGWHDSEIELMNDGELKLRVWNVKPLTVGKVAMNEWHHVVLRYGKTAQIMDGFLDGVKNETKISGEKQWNGSIMYGFGSRDGQHVGHGGFFKGTLDDIRVYNRALSDDEVRRVFNEK
jgi:serine/threonine-protein kinase